MGDKMALFGKADRDLPVLTRFYQVEGDEELALFFEIEDAMVPSYSVQYEAWYYGVDDTKTMPEKFLPLYRRLHAITYELMIRLVDTGGVRPALVEEVISLWHEQSKLVATVYDGGEPGVLPHSGPQRNRNLSEFSENEVVAISRIHLYPKNEEVHPVVVKTLSGLLDVIKCKVRLAKCLVCKNPFVVLRSNHHYCSHRCGHRVALRNARKKLANSQKPLD